MVYGRCLYQRHTHANPYSYSYSNSHRDTYSSSGWKRNLCGV